MPGIAPGRLHFQSDSPSLSQELTLRGSGIGRPAEVKVSPMEVPFGAVQIGSGPRSRFVSVVNLGQQAVDVDVIDPAGDDDVTAVGGDCLGGERLDAGESCRVELRFEPSAVANRSARITIRFTGGLADQQVEVTGEGTDHPGPTVTTPPEPVSGATFAVTPTQLRLGAEATVSGQGFDGETKLYWDLVADSRLWAPLVADGEGRIDALLAVPPDGVVGAHQILACDDGGCTTAGIELVAVPTDGGLPAWLLAVVVIIVGLVGGGAWSIFRPGPRYPSVDGRHGCDGRDGGDDGGDGDDQGDGLFPGERVVHTGFSAAGDPMTPIDVTATLAAGEPYHFWLELGPPVGGLASRPVRLDVVLFGYEGEFAIRSGVGTLELAEDGTATVFHHGGVHPAGSAPGGRGTRLLFPVQAPPVPGVHRIRCSLYHRHVLVQSWVVSATVDAKPRRLRRGMPAVTRERDYVLARSLDPAHLDQLAPHQLSLLLNDSGGGDHSLRVFGENGFTSAAAIPATVLDQLKVQLHRELEEVACERRPGRPVGYRYEGPSTSTG